MDLCEEIQDLAVQMLNIKIILKQILSKNKYKKKLMNKQDNYKNIIAYLLTLYDDSESLTESIYRIVNNIDIKPLCPICGNKIKLSIKSHIYFPKCCCSKCSHKYTAQISKNKCLTLYGIDNYAKLETSKQKYKETCLKKYGVESYYQSNEFKEKSKKTCLKKYGVEHNLQIPQIHQKGIEKSQSSESINKRNNTIFKKYGVDNISKSPLIKRKKENTFLKHYGVKNIFCCKEIKSICNFGEAREKMYITKKKNHTFNTSIPESESYLLLKEKYPDVIRQYRSDVYPYNCDFYIPELDLYIECNYHWTHGYKLFEGNYEDNIKLEKWKQKNTKYYNNAIYTWTDLDIRKYNIAKKNNLNYKIFYNINDFKNWLFNKK